MRIGILADVHANVPALRAVLADLAGQDVDRLVVNGDTVNRGPDSVGALRLLDSVEHDAILGNHDDVMPMIIDRRGVETDSWYLEPFWRSARISAENVARAGYLPVIRAMPLTLRVDLPGAPRLLISHGTPRHYREGIGPSTTPELISEITEEYPTDVLVGSHTHRPYLATWGRYTVINSGAVGVPFTGDTRAHYLILTLEAGKWVPEFRRVPYDVSETLELYESTGMLAVGGLSAEIFREEVRYGRSFMVPFLMWCEEEGHERSAERWLEFRRRNESRFVAAPVYDEVRSSPTP